MTFDKNIRNHIKKHGFVVDGDVLWKYVSEVYHNDCKLRIRMVPKLTNKHIELPPFTNLPVKLATQVLSHSVAVGITTMVSLRALSIEAQTTANFIERIDKLFNCFNSQDFPAPHLSVTPFHQLVITLTSLFEVETALFGRMVDGHQLPVGALD